MKAKLTKQCAKFSGFTLIELIVVILLLSIMSVTVLPKFFTATSFQEYTYQSEVITKLRSIQVRAMQQTANSRCHKVLVTTHALGIPKNCDESLAEGCQSDTTSVIIESNHSVVFNLSTGSSFTFDNMGRPSCSPCDLNITGDSALTVTIESEGYIHAN
jgi:MSHA pilin protein MshC